MTSFRGDPYRILGLLPGATETQVKSAYRRLVKRYHPDAAGDATIGRFLAEVDHKHLPTDAHMLLVGKFLDVGQARGDALLGARRYIERVHGANPTVR